ncbi:hypothetical protein [Natrinema hispanicum]|uniref:DUF8134 domain-containing protein n=1 Tax=Natrinema hispanicum TaxID=392421 RepID=A0A1G6WLS3_9EURY|nr:hypothetical protein [Natrinema hispanicum]SDD66744.1 hypothetical protein SAMN05192552_10382 [Natrinema hispanicum]SET92097.1 hypothetical protein SAMN04488694_1177 [Natrinema hispanicum]
MSIALRTLDDGAWISINDSRQVSVSDVWSLTTGAFCDCSPAYVLLEAFVDVDIDGSIVVVHAVGQCLECGTRDSIERLPVGRIVNDDFYPYDPEGVQWLVEPDGERP